jgi:hypothetical protein
LLRVFLFDYSNSCKTKRANPPSEKFLVYSQSEHIFENCYNLEDLSLGWVRSSAMCLFIEVAHWDLEAKKNHENTKY